MKRTVTIPESEWNPQKRQWIIKKMESIGYKYKRLVISRPCSTCGKVTLHFEKIV